MITLVTLVSRVRYLESLMLRSVELIRRSLVRGMLFGALCIVASPTHLLLAQEETKPAAGKRLLFFTKSSGFQHSVVKRSGDAPAHAERVMMELAKQEGIELTVSKDGTIFDGDLNQFDGFFFYTTGNLTTPGKEDGSPPMSAAGKQKFLDAIKNGKGFIGSHCASDTFHTPGPAFENQTERDPYIEMIGGEFIRHGRQQIARMRVADPKFPGLKIAGDGYEMHEEWYSLKNFAPDMHVILVNETKGMQDKDYDRPPFPATWARKHEKGRVFYTSMGHREDVWTDPKFQSILIGGIRWALGAVDADVTPNFKDVAPEGTVLPKP